MKTCIDCKKLIYQYKNTKRCKSCSKKGKRNINYTHGKSSEKNYCIDCNTEINWKSKRCASCAQKGILHSHYIDGRCSKKYFCKSCDSLINYKTFKYGKQMCSSCVAKERFKNPRNNPRFGKPIVNGKRIYYKNICFRSSWEIKYAKYLDKQDINWLYEPRAFDLGKTTYRPDFYLPKTDEYIEIKGYWRKDALKKFILFKKLYSDIKIKVLTKKPLQKIGVL
jgi:hypothetical protein